MQLFILYFAALSGEQITIYVGMRDSTVETHGQPKSRLNNTSPEENEEGGSCGSVEKACTNVMYVLW